MIVGLVVARGGSKRFPNKALAKIDENSLVGLSILVGKKAQKIMKVVVSTDSDEIHKECIEYKPDWILKRSPGLSEDNSPITDVLKHAVPLIEDFFSQKLSAVVLLQATSPLRTSKLVDLCVEQFQNEGVDTLTTLRAIKEHPDWMWEVRDGTYAPLNKEKFFSSTKEDQQKLFIESGSVYVISRECAAKGEIYGRRVSVIVEEPFTSVDVDYPFDLTLARELFQGIDL
jgi:CMP-N,N'-diacetyllegionaminic acid synthase